MFCTVCRKYPNVADKTSTLFIGAGGGKSGFRKTTLQTHDTSKEHGFCIQRDLHQQTPSAAPLRKLATKLAAGNAERLNILFKAANHIATTKQSFNHFPQLLELLEDCGVDIGSMYRSDNMCRDFIKSIADVEEKCVKEELKDVQFLTVLADGSTDCSVIEQEAVYVRYVSKDGLPKTKLARVEALESATADGVKAAILRALDSIGVTEDVLKEKLVSCNFDGANVMLGPKGGVGVKMQGMVDQPLVLVHCVAHNLELGALDAAKEEKYMKQFNRSLKQIYKFYYYSPKKRRELHSICDLLEVDHAFYTSLHSTRWLASQHRALLAVQKHLAATYTHIEHVAENGEGLVQAKTKGIFKHLRTEKFVRFLHFLIDIMEIFGGLSKQFQADDLFITDIITKLQAAQMKLKQLKLFKGKVYKTFLTNYDSKTGVLKCGENSIVLQKYTGNINETFGKLVDAFVKYMDKRFGKLQVAPITHFMVFDPSSLPCNKDDLAMHGNDDIESLVEFYSTMLTDEQKEGAIDEWTDLKLRLQHNKHLKPQEYYSNLLKCAPDSLQNILVLVKLLITMSPTTAKLERAFSAMKANKSALRNRMEAESLQMTMRIHDSDRSTKFVPTVAVQNWLETGEGKRHCVNNSSESVPGKVERRGRVPSTVPSAFDDVPSFEPPTGLNDDILVVTSF
jgi:hypothetical protein